MWVKRLIANKLCDCTLFQQSTILLNASLSKFLISGPRVSSPLSPQKQLDFQMD